MAYTEEQILEQIEDSGILGLYDAPCVKRKGEAKITTEEGEKYVPYTEVVADWVLRNIKDFASRENFITIDRDDYNVSDEHKKKVKDAPATKHPVKNKDNQPDEDWDEEWIAKFMYNDGNNHYDSVGHIFCCQVPLKKPKGNNKETDTRKESNKGVGNIDMVSYDGKNVYLLELKSRTNTTDSLLRAALEVFKYWKHLNHTNFRNSYYKDIDMSLTVPIVPAILIFKNSLQHDQLINPEYKNTQTLIKRFGIKVFLAEEIGDKKYVIEEARD